VPHTLNHSAVFVGCVRDCESFLPGVLSNLESLSRLFRQSAYVMIENDSCDRTKHLLNDWGRGQDRFHLESLDGLDAQVRPRTARLAIARNRYLDIVRNSDLRDFDYLIVMDLDNVCQRPVDASAFLEAVGYLNSDPSHAGVFANQEGPYYDLWALRHPELCPTDVWMDILAYAMTRGASDEEAFDRVFRPRVFSLPKEAAPIAVDSAFGGLGIYKMPAALGGAYRGEREVRVTPYDSAELKMTVQLCEHVPFNRRITRDGGRLFVMPSLINYTTPHMDYPPSDCRTIVIHQEVHQTTQREYCA
jgi:hypothetical protein